MATNVRGVRALEQHVALMQTTRTVDDDGHSAARPSLRPGTSSGQMDDYRWTVDVSPLGGDWTVPMPMSPGCPSSSGFASDRRAARFPTFAPFA